MHSDPLAAPLSHAVASLVASFGSAPGPSDTVHERIVALLRSLAHSFPGRAVSSLVRLDPRGRGTRTFATSDPSVAEFDHAQQRVGQGPVIDAVSSPSPVVTPDCALDGRWPALAAEPATFRAVISAQVVAPSFRGSLGVYSRQPGAFTDGDRNTVSAVAAVVGLALATEEYRVQAQNLATALETNRTIGVAVGILMMQHGVTRERAFEAMVEVSQQTHRKLRDLAETIVLTGAMPEGVPPDGARRSHRSRHTPTTREPGR